MRKFVGIVQKGKQFARRLGFPTANIPFSEEGVVEGIYGGLTRVLRPDSMSSSSQWCSLIYIKDNLLESYLLDTSIDLYDQEIEVELTQFIRPPAPYTTFENMRDQIKKDLICLGRVITQK